MEELIICPNCGYKFPITEVILGELTEKIRKETEEKYSKIIQGYERMKKELEEKESQLTERELKLNEEINKKIQDKLSLERKIIAEEIRRSLEEENKHKIEMLMEAKEQYEKRYNDLTEQLKNKQSENTKLLLELNDMKIKFEEDYNRRLKEELERRSKEEELKEKEYQYKIQKLQEQIETLNAKAKFDSQKVTGEVQEIVLEETLRGQFPEDIIEPVPGGKKGADVIQTITYKNKAVGKIIWESKKTQRFDYKWIDKLKEDQRQVGAEIAVLVTSAMPKDTSKFTFDSNVIIMEFQYVIPLTILLRKQIIDAYSLKSLYDSKNDIKEQLFNYISSSEFSQNIEIVLSSFIRLKKQIDDERVYMQKVWKEREQLLLNSLEGMAGAFGKIRGIVPSLPDLKTFQITSGKDQQTLD